MADAVSNVGKKTFRTEVESRHENVPSLPPKYANISTRRNTLVVGTWDRQAFQLSLCDNIDDVTGCRSRQDPLAIPYFGPTGVFCIPHCIFVTQKPAQTMKPLMPSMILKLPSLGYKHQRRRSEMGYSYEPELPSAVLKDVQVLPDVDFYVMLHASEEARNSSGSVGLLYHTWVFGADCDPNTDQTADINVACFGIEGMKQQTPSTLAKLSLPVGKLDTRAITLREGRFDVGSTLVPHAATDRDTQRDCPFFSFYALATTTHGSPLSSQEMRAVLTFHVVLRAAHLQQTARAVCGNSHTLEILLAECRVRMPALELSISHIDTAFSACMLIHDQVATTPATPTSTSPNEWDATQSELAVSDLSYSASLVESKAVGEAGAGDGPKIHDDVTDSANTHTGTDAVDKNNSTSRSDDSSDPATAKNYSPPQIPITSDLTPSEVDQEESQEEPEFSTSSQPPNSQQLDMFKQQLQHFESRDQQLLHLVGRNNRELLRQQDEQQHHLEETLTTQQQALAELRAGFRSQQHDIRNLLKLIGEQNSIIQEFRQARDVSGVAQNASAGAMLRVGTAAAHKPIRHQIIQERNHRSNVERGINSQQNPVGAISTTKFSLSTATVEQLPKAYRCSPRAKREREYVQYSAAVVLQARMRGYLARRLGTLESEKVVDNSFIAINTALNTYNKSLMSEQVVNESDLRTQTRAVGADAASESLVADASDSQARQLEAAVLLGNLSTASDKVDNKSTTVRSTALDVDMQPPSPLLSEQEEQEFDFGTQTLAAGADAASDLIVTDDASEGETGQREASAVHLGALASDEVANEISVTPTTAFSADAEPPLPSSSVQEAEESGIDTETAGVDAASEPVVADEAGPATHIQAQVRGWFARQQSKREKRVGFGGVVGKQIDLDSPSASFYLSVGETLGGIRIDENDRIITVSDKTQVPTTVSFDEVEDAGDEPQAIFHGEYNDLIVDGTRAPICFDEAVNIDTGENEADVDIETEGSDEAILHGELNDLLVVGTRAAMYFDEAINVDTGENEGDVDTDELGIDNSDDHENYDDDVHAQLGNMTMNGGDSLSEVSGTSGTLVNSTISGHLPNHDQQFNQISENEDDTPVARENLQSPEQHVHNANASIFDSIMLNLVGSNQTQKEVLQDKTKTLTQPFSFRGRSGLDTTLSNDGKPVPTWVTTTIETEATSVSDNTSAQHTARKASTVHHGGSDVKTEAVGGVVTAAKTSEALHMLSSATSDTSRHYHSTLLSERLPPQQQEPAQDFCTFCRQFGHRDGYNLQKSEPNAAVAGDSGIFRRKFECPVLLSHHWTPEDVLACVPEAKDFDPWREWVHGNLRRGCDYRLLVCLLARNLPEWTLSLRMAVLKTSRVVMSRRTTSVKPDDFRRHRLSSEGRAMRKVPPKKKASPVLKCLSINGQNQPLLSDAKRNQSVKPDDFRRHRLSSQGRAMRKVPPKKKASPVLKCLPINGQNQPLLSDAKRNQVRCRLKAASYAYGQGPRAREKLFAKMSVSSTRKSTKQMRASGEGKWGMHVVNPLDTIDLSEWIKEVRRIAKLQPSEAEQLFYEMNVSGDGRLRFEEFQAFICADVSPPKTLDRDHELGVVTETYIYTHEDVVITNIIN